jgi:hypothetical protein
MHQFTNRRNRNSAVGLIAVGLAMAISSFSIVRAEHVNPDRSKTFNCSSGTACVQGDSSGSTTYGLYGDSSSADGVHGVTGSTNGASAVAGIATATSGHAHGVYGRSSTGNGVEGYSTSLIGVAGYSTDSPSGGAGVYGKGFNGVIGEAAGGGIALVAFADSPSTDIFEGFGSPSSDSCGIDAKANLSCTGTIRGGAALRAQHRNSSGQHVLTYASESATATLEDVGTARMSGGVANVQIGTDFASVMDHRWYYVFLTPLGDTRGLYVSLKTPTGFQVREVERGRSSLEFDYRIVAHPLDAKNDRLPLAPAERVPSRAIRQTQ